GDSGGADLNSFSLGHAFLEGLIGQVLGNVTVYLAVLLIGGHGGLDGGGAIVAVDGHRLADLVADLDLVAVELDIAGGDSRICTLIHHGGGQGDVLTLELGQNGTIVHRNVMGVADFQRSGGGLELHGHAGVGNQGLDVAISQGAVSIV